MLSIVLPCFNPPKNWELNVIQSIKSISEKIPHEKIELIIVNDGTTQNEFIHQYKSIESEIELFQFIDNPQNMGKGHAIRTGIQACSGDLIIYTDIDFPYTTHSFLEIYQAISHQLDVAVGVKDEKYYEKVPAFRRFISKTLRFIIGIFLRLPITDTQCGLKGLKKEFKPLFLSTTISRYLFDLEFVRICFRSKTKINIEAIPITLKDNIVFRSMNPKILVQELGNFMMILLKS